MNIWLIDHPLIKHHTNLTNNLYYLRDWASVGSIKALLNKMVKRRTQARNRVFIFFFFFLEREREREPLTLEVMGIMEFEGFVGGIYGGAFSSDVFGSRDKMATCVY